MDQWTAAEIELAVRLTSKLGYGFENVSAILERQGFARRKPEDISAEIKLQDPKAWDEIITAQQLRHSTELCGVPTSLPQRRLGRTPDDLVAFVGDYKPDTATEVICWAARQAGYDCNIADITIAGRRSKYEFAESNCSEISYSSAIDQDLCLWPVGDGACGGQRIDRKKYCGPHYCRALGGK